MTYEEIMDKIFKLETQLASTNIRPKKKQLQNEIAKLISLRDEILEKNKSAISFGKKMPTDALPEKLPKPTRVKDPVGSKSFIPSLTKKNNNKVEPADESEIKKATMRSRRRASEYELQQLRDAGIQNVSENQGWGGTKPEDRDQNIVEKLVSSLLGRTIRFEDIPDDIDDPDSDVGYKSEGHYAYPAGRPDLRMGGMTSRLGATTKFKKPLGMKGGGNITRAQRQRIARIMQDYKQKKARKSNGKRTNR